jgi:putative addiction module killer protein
LEVTPKELLMYEKDDGTVPFSDWMDDQEDLPIYDIVMKRLDRVELGNLGDHKPVGEGVTELIIDFGPGYRVYIGEDGKDFVILLIGGDKKSQQADIKAAKTYWKNYNA